MTITAQGPIQPLVYGVPRVFYGGKATGTWILP